MHRARASFLLSFLIAAGCAPSDPGSAQARDPSSPIDLNVKPVHVGPLASCWVVKDPGPESVFLADMVQCRFTAPPAPLAMPRGHVQVRNADSSVYLSKSFEPAAYGTVVTVGHVYRDKWPATINLTTELTMAGAGTQPGSTQMGIWFASERSVTGGNLPDTAPLTLDSPVDLWKVVLVPAKAVRDRFGMAVVSGNYEVPAPTTRLCVAGPTVAGKTTVRVTRIARDLEQLIVPLWLPVAATAPAPVSLALQLRLSDSRADGPISIVAPGYLAIEADGAIRPAVQEDVEGLGPSQPTPGPDAGVTGGDATIRTGSDAGMIGADSQPAPPTCGGILCGEGMVCVTSSCVERAKQTAGKTCDGSENGDCAIDNVCVAGKCVLRSYQTPSYSASCDDDDNNDCATGNVCVAGKCRIKSYQTPSYSASCDGDDNGDCAENNVCVAGKCRIKSYQTPSYNATCDSNDNNDCATDNVCVAGKCKIRSYQTSSYNATCDNEDSDCAQGYVCTSGKCTKAP